MISKTNLSIALKAKAKSVADSLGVNISGSYSYQPGANETYLLGTVLDGDIAHPGINSLSSEVEFGVYQISIRTPLNKSDNTCKSLADTIRAEFPFETVLSYSGQSARVRSSTTAPLRRSETHKIIDLSITYSVIS